MKLLKSYLPPKNSYFTCFVKNCCWSIPWNKDVMFVPRLLFNSSLHLPAKVATMNTTSKENR